MEPYLTVYDVKTFASDNNLLLSTLSLHKIVTQATKSYKMVS